MPAGRHSGITRQGHRLTISYSSPESIKSKGRALGLQRGVERQRCLAEDRDAQSAGAVGREERLAARPADRLVRGAVESVEQVQCLRSRPPRPAQLAEEGAGEEPV